MQAYPLLLSVATLILLELFVAYSSALKIVLLALVILHLIAALLMGRQTKTEKSWKFALLPLLANLIGGAYLILINNQTLLQSLIVLLVIFNWFYWRLVYLYLIKSPRYLSFSLENLSFYINFILTFLFGSMLYGLRMFLNVPPWLLGIIVAVVLLIIIYQSAWVGKKEWAKTWVYWLVGWLVLLQAFFVFMLLPLDYNVLGFLWASFYYLIFSLWNDRFANKLNRSKIKLYLILIGVCWLILLITARWL